MRTLEVTLQIRGLSIERGLQHAVQEGVLLTKGRRIDARTVQVCVQATDEAELTRLLAAHGYGVTRVREAGIQRLMRLMRRRALLGVGALMFAMLVLAAGECIWQVSVTGAGAAEGEVRRLLQEAEIAPGRLKAGIDAQAIQTEIERRLPQIKYVDVRVKGMTFTVLCEQAKSAVPAETGGKAGDIYAAKDGIITQMLVRSGTPKVHVGDAVTTGQLLVEGVERGEKGENVAVAAQAQIQAQTFYEGTASVRSWDLHTEPTGRTAQRMTLWTPWVSWPQKREAPFELADVYRTVQPVGGGLFPLWRTTERFQEVTGEKIPRDRTELEGESAKIAAQIAERNIPIGAEVVDKWVDYSMIEEGFCARVIITCIEDIAQAHTSVQEMEKTDF